jgi:hypothetical protein
VPPELKPKSVAFAGRSLVGSDFEAHQTALCAANSTQPAPRGPQFQMTIYYEKQDTIHTFLSQNPSDYSTASSFSRHLPHISFWTRSSFLQETQASAKLLAEILLINVSNPQPQLSTMRGNSSRFTVSVCASSRPLAFNPPLKQVGY